MINTKKEQKFDQEFKLDQFNLENFNRPALQKPLLEVDDDLSTYIYKNTQDSFLTLVENTKNLNYDIFINSVKISVTYVIYMCKPTMSFTDKGKLKGEVLTQVLKIKDKDVEHDKILKRLKKWIMHFEEENI